MITGAHSCSTLHIPHSSLPSPHTHTHTHTDMLTGVSLIFPVQYYSIGAIPTGVSLPFSSNLSTGYSTHIYGVVYYDWNFGDGHILHNTSNSSVSHMYTHPGSLQLTVTARGLSTTARNITTLRLYQRESGYRAIHTNWCKWGNS